MKSGIAEMRETGQALSEEHAVSSGWGKFAGILIRCIRVVLLVFLMIIGPVYWSMRICGAIIAEEYQCATPPTSVQTFDDFLTWIPEIKYCREVKLRGATYYHVIGPDLRNFSSGGALYVFDAHGNFVG